VCGVDRELVTPAGWAPPSQDSEARARGEWCRITFSHGTCIQDSTAVVHIMCTRLFMLGSLPPARARSCMPLCLFVHRRSSFLRVCATVLPWVPPTGWRLATRAGLWALGALTRAHSMATTHVVPNSTRTPHPPRAARPRHAPSHGLHAAAALFSRVICTRVHTTHPYHCTRSA
jgi:hypothetical protein